MHLLLSIFNFTSNFEEICSYIFFAPFAFPRRKNLFSVTFSAVLLY
ncbi:Hypothetical protein OINT_2000520 [Brucella intermedia LMG 3301]|uniref:Uncharacterized protein n=1 Tax=Brucella intermedia LMG 3301 TaxID=641118 RepID=C4WNP2_9HYPH|nr:Hypothetical protein OINT_2000520 [Brucella intermedia LMG 3301]